MKIVLIMLVAALSLFCGATMPGSAMAADNIDQIRQEAEQGVNGAQLVLGTLYYHGKGVPQDYKEAAKWFRLAAVQGNILAQFNLGFMYANGQGVPQDYREAVKWLRLSAEQGGGRAQMMLATIYYTGRQGVPKDYVESYAWLVVAAAGRLVYGEAAKQIIEADKQFLQQKMTASQITAAQQQAKEIQAKIVRKKNAAP